MFCEPILREGREGGFKVYTFYTRQNRDFEGLQMVNKRSVKKYNKSMFFILGKPIEKRQPCRAGVTEALGQQSRGNNLETRVSLCLPN